MILSNYILNQGQNYILQKFSLKFNFLIPKPSNLIIFLTYKCNLRCKYCQSWKYSNKNKELEIDDWKKIILQFKEWIGPYHLTLTGGEPFQKKSIMDLIRFLCNKNIRTNILTNGSLLHKKLCKELIDSKIDTITISLDSLKSNAYDYITEKKGLCKIVKSNLELLKWLDKNNKLQIYIATVINKMNLEELPDLVEYTKKMNLQGIKFQAINFETIGNETYDTKWYRKTQFWPQDNKKIKSSIKKLINMKKNYPIWNSKKQLKMIESFFKNPKSNKHSCIASRTNLCVDPYGSLGFCELKNKLGHLTKYKLKDFWYSEKLKKIRNKKCDRTCRYLNMNSDRGFTERIKGLRLKTKGV